MKNKIMDMIKKPLFVCALFVSLFMMGAGCVTQGFGNLMNNGNKTLSLPTVTNPQPHTTIYSPLKVSGEASGWYFEGTFPVRLEDNNGNFISESYVTAQEDWMTNDPVAFEGEIDFLIPEGVTEGRLVFEKSNPSDLPQNSDSISVPVKFAQTTEQKTMNLKLFFSNREKNPNMADCTLVFPVTRSVPFTLAVGHASLEALLVGPTDDEKKEGFRTLIPEGVTIQSLRIENSTAYVDFSDKLDSGVSGSCNVSAIVAQISETLKQFETVNKVVISINGETETILQP